MEKGLVSKTSVALLLCFSMLVAGSLVEAGDLVQTTCGKTGYNDLCISTLRSDPRSSSADVKGLAEIALEVARVKSNDTLNYFLKLIPRESDLRRYGTCIDTYMGNVDRIIPGALTDLANNQFVEAKGNATIAATNAQACEDQFIRLSSPATSQNKAAHDVAAVAADIIGTLYRNVIPF